jgi:hypothetical protein
MNPIGLVILCRTVHGRSALDKKSWSHFQVCFVVGFMRRPSPGEMELQSRERIVVTIGLLNIRFVFTASIIRYLNFKTKRKGFRAQILYWHLRVLEGVLAWTMSED